MLLTLLVTVSGKKSVRTKVVDNHIFNQKIYAFFQTIVIWIYVFFVIQTVFAYAIAS